MSIYFEKKPWGIYDLLDNQENFKVKKIEILPKQRISYQKHQRRSEHWFIVQGSALITIEDKEFQLDPGQSIDIKPEMLHRIANPSEDEILILIEVQTGTHLSEDDIVRLADDYGRHLEMSRSK